LREYLPDGRQGSVGRARPCQGRGREFPARLNRSDGESRFPLRFRKEVLSFLFLYLKKIHFP